MKQLYILACVILLFTTISSVFSYPKDSDSVETKKSLNSELSNKDFKRNPKLGFFNISLPAFPTLTPPASGNNTRLGLGNPNLDLDALTPNTATATIGSSAILIKGGILKGLAAVKAAIVPPIFLGAMILFLIAGAAFFACSILDCGLGGGGLGGLGGHSSYGSSGGFGQSLFQLNRNSYDQFEQQQQQSRPVFQALDDSYNKKYN